MQLRSTTQPLIRRLLGHYLMFGLASIIVLSLGWLFVVHSMLHANHEHDLITRITEVRSLIVADQSKNRGVGTQTLINLLGTEDWVAYAAVVGADGTFSAHSQPSRIGRPIEEQFVHGGREGVIERHVAWNDGFRRREYWVPLTSGESEFGSLQVGVVDQADSGWLGRMADWLPYAILAPILILALGALFLRSAAHTNNAIEDQLCAVSASNSVDEFHLEPLSEPSPTANGWNRIVERALGSHPATNFDAVLNQALRGMQDKRYERILNSLADGVAVTDSDGRITFANRAFGVLLPLAGDNSEVRGRLIKEFFSPSTNLLMNAGEESRPAVFEIKLGDTSADGVLRVGRSPLLNDDNNSVLQHIWTVRDVTQQKLADEMRTQFVYSATHELRTPLANIKAYAETLTMNDLSDPEQQKSFLNIINSEATRLARFVEELLNVSQMEAGSLSLVRTEVDFERTLMEVADKVRPQMVQKNIAFDLLLPAKLPKVHVDKDKFVAALVNLLGNAAKYTPDNGRVTFKAAAGSSDIQISVEDTGIGISSEELPKLCTKFFRSSDVRVRDIPGSGLGLSFTQEVVRLHGGKMIVHSELNKGSQFALTLPI